MANSALQRLNMVESQVRPSDVTDRRIIRAMSDIARERFLPGAVRAIAYMDGPVPVTGSDGGSAARFLLAPRVLARLVQLMEIIESDAILDIGCMTGYSTAVLAHLGRTVVALEEDAGLAERARTALAELGITNASVVQGPLPAGVPAEGPYDAILINGAVDDIPPALLDQLKDGARLVAVRSDGVVGRATVWRRIGARYDARAAFDAAAAMLPGFARRRGFVF